MTALVGPLPVPFHAAGPTRATGGGSIDHVATRKRRLRSVPIGATPTDELLVRAGRGDEAAFAEVYDQLAGLVHGTVRRVLRDPAQSEEVTQEVFLELWRLAPRFDPAQGSARSWAATMAHRRAVDRVRAEEASRSRDQSDARSRRAATPDISEEIIDMTDRREVADALDGLTDTQREAVTLAYYGGHTYREVAALLDVPEGTVKTRIRDGLIRLRDRLGVTT